MRTLPSFPVMKRRYASRERLALAVVLVIVLIVLYAVTSLAARADTSPPTPQTVPDTYLVKVRPPQPPDPPLAPPQPPVDGGSQRGVGGSQRGTAAADGEDLGAALDGGVWRKVVRPANGKSAADRLAEIAASPDVLAVEPLQIATIDDAGVEAAVNDPLAPQQWHLARIGAAAAWDVSDGRDVTVYVLDTGVDRQHPDLAARVKAGPDFVTGDGDPDDVQGHGTHVASLAAAITNNGVGVAGVGYNAGLVAVRVLGDNGSGSLDAIGQGIRWVADQAAPRRIINMSLGMAGDSQYLLDCIRYAESRGVLVVAAAGNSATSLRHVPAAYAFGVGATDSNDKLAGFSNFGENTKLVAPGVNLLAAVQLVAPPGGAISDPSGYKTLSGTSMAAPVVSGAAALVWSAHPDWSAEQVEAALLQSADPVGDALYYGAGRLNVARAVGVAAPAPQPTPPVSVPTATPDPRTNYSQRVAQLINAERRAQGLPALAWNDQLALAAHNHNLNMNACAQSKGVTTECFSHQMVGEPSPWQRAVDAGWRGAYLTENIGHGYTSPEAMIQGWMGSAGHRANILSPRASQIGVDFYDGSGSGYYMGLWWTAMFADGGATATPQPTLPPGYRMVVTLDYDRLPWAVVDQIYREVVAPNVGRGVVASWVRKYPSASPVAPPGSLPAGWLMTVVVDYDSAPWAAADSLYRLAAPYRGNGATLAWPRK